MVQSNVSTEERTRFRVEKRYFQVDTASVSSVNVPVSLHSFNTALNWGYSSLSDMTFSAVNCKTRK